MTKLLVGVAAALALLSVSGGRATQASPIPGFGSTVYVTSESETTGDTAIINFANLPGGHTSLSVYTAPLLISGTFGASGTVFSSLLAYCTDLYDFTSTTAKYTVGYLTSSHQPSGYNDLTVKQLNEITTLISANNKDQAATQLAIWSVEYGNAFSFTDATGSTREDTATYLAALNGSAPTNVSLYQLQEAGVQGMAYTVSASQAAPSSPIGEPAGVTLVGVGLIGLTLARLRKRGRRGAHVQV